ncbi:nucleotide-binding protein [Kitasatospora sp. NPDC002040]|uniref:nucleotide-binding protein n=1 Tax=Kitasatospora sp. NPDC002040 TaxID=3154661 RepID=UPI00331E862E
MTKVALIGSHEVLSKKIDVQLVKGRALLDLPRASVAEVETFQSSFFTWNEYTQTLLTMSFKVEGALTSAPPGEFIALDLGVFDVKYGTAKTAEAVRSSVLATLEKKLRVLESINDRLEIWVEAAPPVPRHVSGDAIFLVHGRDHATRETVRSFLQQVASRDVIVLDEQAGKGADILGKLLNHAQKAAYAIVLLTGDDEGRLAGEGDLKPRARQNVILELGLFLGLLGRQNVMALYEPGVEIPSDFLGVTYVELDPYKAWRMGVVSELRAAGIDASIDRTLG